MTSECQEAMVDFDERIAVSAGEAAESVGVSRAALYPRITSGELPSFRLGRRRLIRVRDLENWIRQRAEGDAATALGTATIAVVEDQQPRRDS